MRLNQVTVPALNVDESVSFYQTLGLKLIVRSPHYARFELPEGGSTFSVHLAETVTVEHAPVVYFECHDLDAECAGLKAAGIAFESGPADQPWLWREAYLRDPSHNRICLYHAGENRLNPPWRLPEPDVFHIVMTEGRLLVVKRPNTGWRALQDEFADYKASLGPYSLADVLEYVELEWPDIFEARAADIVSFAFAAEDVLDL